MRIFNLNHTSSEIAQVLGVDLLRAEQLTLKIAFEVIYALSNAVRLKSLCLPVPVEFKSHTIPLQKALNFCINQEELVYVGMRFMYIYTDMKKAICCLEHERTGKPLKEKTTPKTDSEQELKAIKIPGMGSVLARVSEFSEPPIDPRFRKMVNIARSVDFNYTKFLEQVSYSAEAEEYVAELIHQALGDLGTKGVG